MVVASATTVPGARGADARVNLNTATVEELVELPGVGPARAHAIVERRQETPFRNVDELRDVPGIGDRLFEQIKERVEVTMIAEGKGAAPASAGGGGKK
jgi:competence protein ComEA